MIFSTRTAGLDKHTLDHAALSTPHYQWNSENVRIMLANAHALNICLDNANQSCPESSLEQDDEAMQLSDSDTDTDDDYMLEDDIMDL